MSSSDLSETEIHHKPFVPDEQQIPEFTLLPVIVGVILGIIFGASSLYLVLKVGMTISASIPVAVISITLFRALSKFFGMRQATILENNIVQTTGSAGESIAFGVGVTMPALMILGYEMDVIRVMTVAVLGGLLGVLMMIPLRRGLIVKQHGKLTYPEGTACAEVLIVGEQGGTNAKTVFSGFGLGFLYKLLMSGFKLWSPEPGYKLEWYKGTQVSGELAPELLGVGYIIGPRTAGIMMGGGVLSTLVLIPLIKMFGERLTEPLYPGTTLISAMDTHDIWKSYVLYIGAGAVAAGGIISLFSSLPLIFSAFRAGLKDFSVTDSAGKDQTPRTDRDLPLSVVVGGTLLLVALVWLSPMLNVTLPGAILIVMFGFLFVTVSSRLTGEIGSSSNPISGMTVSTLLLTCLIFLFMGWTGAEYRLTALSIAAVVCIAASNGGTCSQDLKTGFLVGATPKYQQISILVGALTSALVIGGTLLALNTASTVYVRPPAGLKYRADVSKLTEKESLRGPEAVRDTRVYAVLRLTEATDELQAGKYLVNEDGSIAWIIDPGINGTSKYHECNRRYLKIDDPQVQAFTLPAEKLAALETVSAEIASAAALPMDQTYRTLLLDQKTDGVEAGKYLVDAQGKLQYKVDPGPEVPKYDSPKAKLMSLIIDGILTQKLPWILVIIGAFIAVLLELCQVSSLPFAVGVYLPFSASVPIFCGGMVRWLVDATSKKMSDAESESSPGVLVSSGLIAGGSIAGIALALMALYENALAHLDFSKLLSESHSSLVSAILFALMSAFLFAVGKGWLLSGAASEKPSDGVQKP